MTERMSAMWEQMRPRVRGIYYALTRESIPLHRGEQSQPFFIVGSGRCGTTLLRRILQASPEVHIPPENWGLGHVIRSFRQNSWHLDWDQLVEVAVAAHQHKTHGWFEGKEAPDDLLNEVIQWPKTERSLYHLIDRLYRYHGESVEAEFGRWGDKTPLNINHMEKILKVFTDGRFVHLVRDGVDVSHSWFKSRPDYSDVLQPAQRWKNAVRSAHKFSERHTQRLIEVRYERLCEKPKEVTRQVCEFLNLSYKSDLVERTDHFDELGKDRFVGHFENAFEKITTDSVGKGRRKLSTRKKEKIAPLINNTLVQLGYPPAEK
jgi:hypothetical protein